MQWFLQAGRCATNRPAWRNHYSQGIKINHIEIKKKNIKRKMKKERKGN